MSSDFLAPKYDAETIDVKTFKQKFINVKRTKNLKKTFVNVE